VQFKRLSLIKQRGSCLKNYPVQTQRAGHEGSGYRFLVKDIIHVATKERPV
jgi:hypothetical protein